MAYDKQFNIDTLSRHNEWRAHHGTAALSIDWDLAKSAQKYADELAKTNKFAHSDSNGKYGENLANSYNSRAGYVFSGAQATQNWYDEVKDYKFGEENQKTGKIGHFSQVIWKSTKTAGFGRAKSDGGTFIVVGQYKPPGNFIGQFKENVPPPGKDAPPVVVGKDVSGDPSHSPAAPKQSMGWLCCGGLRRKSTVDQSASSGAPKPQIGPRSSDDKMVKSSTKTTTGGPDGVTKKEVTETYKTPSGETYEVTQIT